MKFIYSFFIVAIVLACNSPQEKIESPTSKLNSHFEIKDSLQYTIIEIKQPFVGAGFNERYLLFPREESVPTDIRATHFIPIPVDRIAINSTTHLGFLSALEAVENIVAATNLDFYLDSTFLKKVKNEELISLGNRAINHETLIHEEVDVLFSFAIDIAAIKDIEQLRMLDQNIVLISEYMEQDPLKKAEWIKVFACFLDLREKADSIFSIVEQNYQSIKKKASKADDKPKVMIGRPWKGTWYVSGGDSYQAKLIKDANANYLWAENKQEGGLPLDIESVYHKALDADFWINPGNALSKEGLLANNEKFASFDAFKNEKVYSNYKRVNVNGGNDYWEGATVRPDLVLSDLYHIFHQEGKADSLQYYMKLE